MTTKLSRIVSDFETSLTGAISVGATSFTIQSVVDLDGTTLSNGTYCFTLDRDNTGAKEYLVGQLDNATKTVSSVSSVGRQGALTANAQKAHRIGANVIISDHSILSTISRIFNGVDTIDPSAPLAYTSAPTLSSATQLATKGYVDSVVTGGTVNTDRIILGSQTAGETVAEGNIVYFKSSDSRWWLADADLVATFQDVQLGIAQGAGTAGNTISGGVLIYGKSDNFTGLTATATYYLSNTAGAVSSSAGTFSVILGQAFATTGIFFNPNTILTTAVSTSAGSADAGKVVKLNADGLLDVTFGVRPVVNIYDIADSPATWTKPAGLNFARVQVWGGGGAGGSGTDTLASGAGGGGGEYREKVFFASELGSSETATVGAGGVAVGGNGGDTTFGSLLTAKGGVGGGSSSNDTAVGGAGGTFFSNTALYGTANMSALFSGGGSNATTTGGSSYYGGAGGGGGQTHNVNLSSSGGTSIQGGNGGGGSVSGTATNGSVPSGGGGGVGSSAGTAGNGAAGRIIVTEFF